MAHLLYTILANTDERLAMKAVIDCIQYAILTGDKGFLSVEWQAQMLEQTSNTILTPNPKNQKFQHPIGFERSLNSVCERIDGVIH